ncbi:GldG family protein [Geminisphaera colitermitum]|uniref:GldG family protein n=1 Tax=Geminisphaera colitermitum TaxID=1148786 RepID=UPI0005BA5A06|nr:GldG family protein [Geminisphaera colitermitum]
MKLGSKIIAVVLLVAAVFLINYLATRLPVRVDSTSGGIYTLSPGTKSILTKIEEPITLDYYFSRDAEGLPVSYKNYAARVQELLRQYVRASKGRLTLNVVNPKPDTPEEERATSYGLQAQTIPTTGESVFFGVVAIQADQQKSIPALNPQREAFLEYDLSQLIYSVQQIEKPRLGLITSLPLRGQQPNMMMMMQQQQRGTPPQFIYTEWEKTFTLVPIEATATELPANLAALAIIHPQGLSEQLEYAIDQFLLGGHSVFLALDPSSQHFARQGGQMAMMGMPPQNVSSDLPRLLKAWGITYNPENVVGDLKLATPINTGRSVERYPIWLSLTRENLGSTAQPTAQLNTLLFPNAGSFIVNTVDTGKNLEVTPLAESSDQAGDLPSFTLQMAQPDDIAKQIIPTGKKLLAAQITGVFKTAFPDGAPKATKDADKTDDADNKAPPAPASAAATAKTLPEGKSTLILVADTDWLFDDFSVRRFNFLGTEAAEPLNDNLAFGSNIVEAIAGASDLISLRGKADANRPFTVVRDMEVAAQKKYQAKLSELEARLNEVQSKLSQLVGKSTEGNRLVATPEMQKAIEDFQKQEVQMRRERREIRRSLREDIDALEYKLAALNLLAVPAAIIVIGLLFHRARRKR